MGLLIAHAFKETNIRVILKVEVIWQYKLAELKGSKLQYEPNKVIHNISSYPLFSVEQSLLCKGLTFALQPQKLKFENHLLPSESLFRDFF